MLPGGGWARSGRSSSRRISRSSGSSASQDPSGMPRVVSVIVDQRKAAGRLILASRRRLTGSAPIGELTHRGCARPVRMDPVADKKAQKTPYVDNGWPTTNPDDHAVSELATDRVGALSPFGAGL